MSLGTGLGLFGGAEEPKEGLIPSGTGDTIYGVVVSIYGVYFTIYGA